MKLELAKLTPQKRHIRALLLDLDGTLYFKGAQIPLAAQTLDGLREMGLKVRFLTNTDSKNTETIQRELGAIGIPIERAEIFSAATAALWFLRSHPGKRCHALVSEELASEFTPFLAGEGAVDYVIVGDFRESVSYDRLNAAFRHVMAGAEIIALQKGRYFVDLDGYNLDTGAFVRLLEYGSGKTAKVLGKPAAEFFRLALQDFDCSPEEVAVVGDDVTTDIVGAQAIGALSVLVRTGKYSDEALACSRVKPDFVVDSIADLPQLLARIANCKGST
jgi:HAD superfamily hydrolase (TIGR01458 family)